MSIAAIEAVIDKLNPTPAFYSLKSGQNWNSSNNYILLYAEASAYNPIEKGNFWSEHIISEGYVLQNQYGKLYQIDKQRILNSINEDIQHTLNNFMRKHFTTPKEQFSHSDMGKWYNKYAFTSSNWPKYQSVMLDIFKYAKENRAFEAENDDTVHCKNTIAMLKFIFERDFNKDHIKRKKRRG